MSFNCVYCKKQNYGTLGDMWSHPECDEELQARMRDGKCIRCGNDSVDGYFCANCDGDSPFVGFQSHG